MKQTRNFTRQAILTFFFLAVLLATSQRVLPQNNQTLRAQPKDPSKAILFSSFIPGGGHFYLGDYETGLLYLAAELGFFFAGDQIKNRLEENEQNIFHIHALKLHELGVFTAYRKARLRINNTGYRNPIDDTPLSQLALAPFRWENIKDPHVYGFFFAGVILNAIEASLNKERRSFQDIDEIHHGKEVRPRVRLC